MAYRADHSNLIGLSSITVLYGSKVFLTWFEGWLWYVMKNHVAVANAVMLLIESRIVVVI